MKFILLSANAFSFDAANKCLLYKGFDVFYRHGRVSSIEENSREGEVVVKLGGVNRDIYKYAG